MLKSNQKHLFHFNKSVIAFSLMVSTFVFIQHPAKAGEPNKSMLAYSIASIEGSNWGFRENKGQLNKGNDDVRYYGSQGGVNVFCKQGAISFVFTKKESDDKVSEATGQLSKPGLNSSKFITSRADLELIGSNINAEIIAGDRQEYYENYTSGNSYNAITKICTYKTITYTDIYPYIDLVLQSREHGLEYSFIVHVGGDVNDIQILWNGLDKMKQLENGGVAYELKPLGGEANAIPAITESAPFSFQQSANEKQQLPVNSSFIRICNRIGFAVKDYDKTKTLIIDPTLDWGTYYGGSNNDEALGISTDSIGNLYIAGFTSSTSGIATSGAYQTSFTGNTDAFIAKFNSSGSRIWTSYFGGNNSIQASGIGLDHKGNIYITGWTNDTSGITTSGIYQKSYGGGTYDAFLARFSNSGSLDWATYFGGTGNDEATGINVYDSANIYITGFTTSTSGIASAGTYQTTAGGSGNDGFLAKFNSSGLLQWGTYFGAGSGATNSNSVITDANDNVYISGYTSSSSGVATSGGFQTSFGGGTYDAFLAQFSSTGSIGWATYFGGGGEDEEGGMGVDGSGNVYITGFTASTSGIATSGAYQTSLAGKQNAFIAEFNKKGLLHTATYYGGNNFDNGNAISIDSSGNIYIAGSTNSTTGIATSGAYQTSNSGGYDAFAAKFNNKDSLISATYYGGTNYDNAIAAFADNSNNLYLTGYTSSTSGIATSGSYQTSSAGGDDAFIAKFTFSQCVFHPAINGNVSLCTNSIGAYSATKHGTDTYSWKAMGGTIISRSNIDSINVKWVSAGNDTLWLFESSGICKDSVMEVVAVNQPNAYAGADQEICNAGNSVIIGPSSAGAPYKYNWTSVPIGFTSTLTDPIVAPTTTTHYILNVRDTTTGCTAADTVVITVGTAMSTPYGTYFGGAGVESGYSIARDKFGNTYIIGFTTSGSGIATKGAYQTKLGGAEDAFLAKYNCSGNLEWATYFGGNDDDGAESIATDDSGNVYLSGWTYSTAGIATNGAYQTTNGGSGNADAFLVKFNGSGSRLWATYYGGSGNDFGTRVTIDKTGNIYFTGSTSSGSNIATSGAYITSLPGLTNAFLAKFNSSGSISWATYYGGNDYDNGAGVVLDSSGNIYITGSTLSTAGIATAGAYQTSYAGGSNYGDAFLAKFNKGGSLLWATYYGGSKDDFSNDVTTDGSNVYITGATLSSSGIATVGAYQTSFAGGSPYGDAFLAKFNSSGHIQWATYYGGSGDEVTEGINVDYNKDIYIAGQSGSSSGIATSGAYQTSLSGSNDAFIAKFNSAGSRQYGTYFGDSTIIWGIVSDNFGNVFMGGIAGGNSRIVTSGAYQTAYGGNSDAFFAELNVPSCSLNPAITGKDTECQNSMASYTAKVNGTNNYLWRAKGGKIVYGQDKDSVSILWNKSGNDTLWLIESSGTCKDSVDQVILVNNSPLANAGNNQAICSGSAVNIGDTAISGDTYSWTSNPTGFTSTKAMASIRPAATTTYLLRETITATGCNKSDSVVITVNPAPLAKTGSNQTVCAGDTVAIGAVGVSGHSYSWSSNPAGFTNASSSQSVSPTVTTTYYLTETILTSACSKSDSVVITVRPLPLAKTGNTSFVCLGSSAKIGDTAVSGDTYSWTSNPKGFTSTSSNPTISPTINTTYYLTETNTATGCKKTNSLAVIASSKLVVSAGGNDTACSGSGPYLLAAGSPSGGVWAGYKVFDSAGAYYFNPGSAGPGNYTMKYTFTSSGCGTASDSIIIKVLKTPVITITSIGDICQNAGPVKLAASPSGGVWFSNILGIVSGDTFNTSKVIPGTYTVYYLWGYKGGPYGSFGYYCNSVDSVSINVDSIPDAGFTTINDSENVYTFTAEDTNSVNKYSWMLSDTGKIFTGRILNDSFNKPGHDTIHLQVSNAGCTAKRFVVITIAPPNGISQSKLPVYNIDVFPNPFTNQTTISYHLIQAAYIRIEITDMEGGIIAVLANAEKQPGEYSQSFLPSKYNMQAGIYLLRIFADGAPVTKKIIKID